MAQEGNAPLSKRSLSKYYNASQLRADTWNQLKDAAFHLANPSASKGEHDKHRNIVQSALEILEPIELYWAFPGHEAFAHIEELYRGKDFEALARIAARVVKALVSRSYRRRHIPLRALTDIGDDEDAANVPETADGVAYSRPYFQVLVVDNVTLAEDQALRAGLRTMRRAEDPFIYDAVVVPTFEDALISVLLNHDVQAVVIRYGFPFRSRNDLEPVKRELRRLREGEIENVSPAERGPLLATIIGRLRPELDVYLVTDASVEAVAACVPKNVRRVFYQQEDFLELHLNILRGINARYQTPFFNALKEYSKQPTGVFHAMPISRGKSIVKSNWIQDMGQFYGMSIFLAETSATSGGLDSLLDPKGPIKKAQELAARAFGARQTFFCTNGTSTANKIVVQSLVKPGDIVLVDRDCHKSHHYGLVLTGAEVVYLDSYPLHPYSMYGAVPLKEIKRHLLALRRAGKLDRVRMLLLTNCTFDGIVYNVERVMEECLAIKPDLVFLWDEAWFGFARCGPTYRQRTGMAAAATLLERYRNAEYRTAWQAFRAQVDLDDDTACLANRLMPDPDRARVRVYVTQSTHKTLTALRQGSMIHVFDQDFHAKVEDALHEAYMTHTSTSPNYQIVASLDVGRRQAELEGFELVSKQVEMAMVLRETVASHPLLRKHFHVLKVKDMIPAEFRPSGIESYYDPETGWTPFWDAWATDEFVLDATRLTLFVGQTGLDGDTFKNKQLMDKHGIQINKTSRNTVLFMTHIGTTRSSVAYLIEVLISIAQEIEEQRENFSPAERRVFERQVKSLCEDLPPLPDFSRFHDRFRPEPTHDTPEGSLREAYFLAYDEDNCEYLALDDRALEERVAAGEDVVAATFVIPYPPGFPILVPGQVVSREILVFMRALDVKEIHGYRPMLGLKVFRPQVLAKDGATAKRSARAAE